MRSVMRPIIGIENRTAEEVFDIMCDRIKSRQTFTEESRDSIAEILETIAHDGLPGSHDLDVALDAIEGSIEFV